MISKWLVQDLIAEGLWTEDVRRQIIRAQGRLVASVPNTALHSNRVLLRIRAGYRMHPLPHQMHLQDRVGDSATLHR